MTPKQSRSLMDFALREAEARAEAASRPNPPPSTPPPSTPAFQGLGALYPDYDPVRRTYAPQLETPPSGWQWQYARPGPYATPLDPRQEAQFQQWVRQNNVPFDPSARSDYDMRGFWLAGQRGDPRAVTQVNPNDNRIHFHDAWKTPYHMSFSNQSIYALPNAPAWNHQDQLIDSGGNVVFDEPAWTRKQVQDQSARRRANQVGFQQG